MWNSYLIADLPFEVISEIMNCKKEKPMYLVVKERKKANQSHYIDLRSCKEKSWDSERNVKDNWLSKCGDEEEMARGLNAIGGGRQ